MISDSLRELSKRVAERHGQKVVVKLMYDRGTPKQVRTYTKNTLESRLLTE